MTQTALLSRLQIGRIRNLSSVRLEGLKRVNLFFGRNGSGKTSLLESIHLLGMARSFRGSGPGSLITHGEPECTVFGVVTMPGSTYGRPIGVQRRRSGDVQIRIGGRAVRTVAELAEQLPLLVINSDSFDLLTGSPAARRQFLDWGVFHVEHRFFQQWQRFQRCMKQRNNLLRHGKMAGQQLAVWTRDLAVSGNAIHDYRQAYFDQLTPRFKTIMARLAPAMEGLELRYRRGWDRQSDYREALENSVTADMDQGFTHVGPQRADLRVLSGGHLAAETLSRGQQKLVVCGLKLAQGQLMADMANRQCIYLIDDLPAELDRQHCELVCAYLAEVETQIFLTCVQREDILGIWPLPGIPNLAMFHVEHGSVEHYTPSAGCWPNGTGSPNSGCLNESDL